jgi:hypothetical protein
MVESIYFLKRASCGIILPAFGRNRTYSPLLEATAPQAAEHYRSNGNKIRFSITWIGSTKRLERVRRTAMLQPAAESLDLNRRLEAAGPSVSPQGPDFQEKMARACASRNRLAAQQDSH